MRAIIVCLILISFVFEASAQRYRKRRGRPARVPAQQQEGDYRFAPPPMEPPEYDEIEDEELGDENFSPPPPPPTPPGAGTPTQQIMPQQQQPPPPPPPPRDNPAFGSSKSGKLRFKIVEGEFYTKGKKRGRGQKVTPSN